MTKIHVYTAMALALTVGSARAARPPQLQEGLWEVRIQGTENPGGKKTQYSFKLCRNHAFDKETDNVMKNNKNCTTKIQNLADGKFSAESRCMVSGIVIVSKGLSVYQSNTSLHSESAATYTPPLYGKTDETMIQDQQYMGACPAGMKPGDRLLADGRVVHRSK